MSLSPSPIPPNATIAYVMPSRVTDFPDGSRRFEAASYYSQQQSVPASPMAMPNTDLFAPPILLAPQMIEGRDSKTKRALRSAFNPRDLAIDTGLGALVTLLFTGFNKIGNHSHSWGQIFKTQLGAIPLMIALGILFRAFLSTTGGYGHRR